MFNSTITEHHHDVNEDFEGLDDHMVVEFSALMTEKFGRVTFPDRMRLMIETVAAVAIRCEKTLAQAIDDLRGMDEGDIQALLKKIKKGGAR